MRWGSGRICTVVEVLKAQKDRLHCSEVRERTASVGKLVVSGTVIGSVSNAAACSFGERKLWLIKR